MEFTLYTYEPAEDLPRLSARGFPAESYFTSNISDAAEGALEAEAEGEGPHVVVKVTVPEEVLYVPEKDIEDALDEDDDDAQEEDEETPEKSPEEKTAEEKEYQRREAEFDAATAPYEAAIQSYEDYIETLHDAGYGDDSPEFQTAEQMIQQNEAAMDQVRAQHFPEEAEEVVESDSLPEPSGRSAREENPEDWPKTIQEAVELTQSATLSAHVEASAAIVLGHPDEVFHEDLTPVERTSDTWFRFQTPPVPLASFKRPYWKRVLRAFFGLKGSR